MVPPDTGTASGRPARSRAADAVVRRLIAVSGWVAILTLAAIAFFLFRSSLRAIGEVGLWPMLSGSDWYPTSDPPSFGFLAFVAGSLKVTLVALVLSVPVGIASAVFISEFAGPRLKEVAKSIVEFMAAVPSVVYGLLGLAVLVPVMREATGVGLSALTAGIVLSVMVLPTIVSISEDALHAVPEDLRQGSLALGNTGWQTVYKVVLPSAASGVFAGVMLGVGRAIGETMVVLMLAGNSVELGLDLNSPTTTMTAVIAQQAAEVVRGGLHYSALFFVGLVLFVITFLVNLAGDMVLERQRARWRR